jgi:NAD(P)-dependent dehydrogenase (short-subunit alcohol dehydrogenase family)
VAKASLNMLTRTSAEDYAAFRVYMNSVDTGWVTDEEPLVKPTRDASGLVPFQPPLDEIDGAARVLDPVRALSARRCTAGSAALLGLGSPLSLPCAVRRQIFVGVNGGPKPFGKFLKDYKSSAW